MAAMPQDIASQIKPELKKQLMALQQVMSEKMEPFCDMLTQMSELRRENAEMHRRTLEVLANSAEKCVDVPHTDTEGHGKEVELEQRSTKKPAFDQVREASLSTASTVKAVGAAGLRTLTDNCSESLTGLDSIMPHSMNAASTTELCIEEFEQEEKAPIRWETSHSIFSLPASNIDSLAQPASQKGSLRKSRTSPMIVPAPPGGEPEILDVKDPTASNSVKLASLKPSHTFDFGDRLMVSVREFEVSDSIALDARRPAARLEKQRKVEAIIQRDKNRNSLDTTTSSTKGTTVGRSMTAGSFKTELSSAAASLKKGFSFGWLKNKAENLVGDLDDGYEQDGWGNESRASVRYGQGQRVVFADADALKEKLRLAICQPKYDVAMYYWETGWCQSVARSHHFENLTLFIIALNAFWIAVDTELNDAEALHQADLIFQIAENAFAIYFAFEWAVRFCAFRLKRMCFRDAWFVFDTLLVMVMVLETWAMTLVLLLTSAGNDGAGFDTSVMRLFRLLRLTRMARMAKLLVAMPELHILIKGLLLAFRSVFFTLLFLLVIVYIFAIAFTQLLVDTDSGRDYFSSVLDSMLSLGVNVTFMDGFTVVVRAVGRDSVFAGFVLFLFVLLVTLSLMNMLIGILCEVVTVVSAMEKETALLTFVKQRMQAMLTDSGLDRDGDGMITKDEFEQLLDIPEAARALQEVGVDVVGLVDFADFIFGLNGNIALTFPDFMDVVLQLRGSNNATVKDMVDMRKFITQEMSCLEDALHKNLASTIRKTQMQQTSTYRSDSSKVSQQSHPSLHSDQETFAQEEAGREEHKKDEDVDEAHQKATLSEQEKKTRFNNNNKSV